MSLPHCQTANLEASGGVSGKNNADFLFLLVFLNTFKNWSKNDIGELHLLGHPFNWGSWLNQSPKNR